MKPARDYGEKFSQMWSADHQVRWHDCCPALQATKKFTPVAIHPSTTAGHCACSQEQSVMHSTLLESILSCRKLLSPADHH